MKNPGVGLTERSDLYRLRWEVIRSIEGVLGELVHEWKRSK